jgi:putative endonuclease
MQEREPAVYIMANRKQGALYTGVTSALVMRVLQHREGTYGGFSAQYGTKLLVWFERHQRMDTALLREKRIKEWKRAWKITLIEEANPDWFDLGRDLGLPPLPALGRKRQVMGPGVRRDDGEL